MASGGLTSMGTGLFNLYTWWQSTKAANDRISFLTKSLQNQTSKISVLCGTIENEIKSIELEKKKLETELESSKLNLSVNMDCFQKLGAVLENLDLKNNPLLQKFSNDVRPKGVLAPAPRQPQILLRAAL